MTHPAFTCRACNSPDVATLIEFGRLPLVGAFVRDEAATDDQFTETITLVMCRACALLQIKEAVPRERMFSSYLWVSGTSETAKQYGRWLGDRLKRLYGSSNGRPFLVEVASNDGFMLRHYREAGFDILGVDPSNLAEEADAAGVPSIRDFFGLAVAQRIASDRGQADVIVARNVLGHVSELQDLVAGMKRLLKASGVLVVEVPYALLLRDEVQYDTIFHEHLSYFTAQSIANLMARFGLKMTGATFVRMNGGSILCEIRHDESPEPTGVQPVQPLLDVEDLVDVNRPSGWRRFVQAVEQQRHEFTSLLDTLAAEGRRVVAYGAAGKCMAMLNYCKVSPRQVSAIGDANPRKQGLLCPGVRIPVVSPEELTALNPDYIVIGAWNFTDEIIGFFKERMGYRNRFIVPLPTPRVVT
jgi:SAM-dependent methyltransferase